MVAGLPTDRFLFAGFPPPKSTGRRTLFAELAPIRATLVFYEGGSRLAACLADMAEVFGARPAVVARELTKLHETVVRGVLPDLAGDPRFAAPKGEIVVLVGAGAPSVPSQDQIDAALLEALNRRAPGAAASEVATALDLSRQDLYARALALRGGK
jgi:16S rRNA (cytidine1402-2'-O)-methyltransferase